MNVKSFLEEKAVKTFRQFISEFCEFCWITGHSAKYLALCAIGKKPKRKRVKGKSPVFRNLAALM